MTDVLHHGFASPRADGADATQIQPSHWNTGHKFQGGVAGDLLIRDPSDANYGAKWRPGVAVVFPSNTGTVNDWAPGLVGNTFVQWVGAANVTVTGLAGGVVGQTVTIANYGSGVLSLLDQSTLSLAANRFRLLATSAPTPIAYGGSATFVHNGAVWVLVAHEQGAWITPAFSAADYTAQAGSWIVDAADVQYCKYRLNGRTLFFQFYVAGTTLTASSGYLRRTFFGGFTVAGSINMMGAGSDAGATRIPILVNMPAAAVIDFYVNLGVTTAWQPSTNNSAIFAAGAVEVH